MHRRSPAPPLRRRLAPLAAWLIFGTPQTSRAAIEPPRAEDAVAPPVLESFAQADYPEESLTLREEGIVGLRLTIDATGAVTGAEVVRGVSAALDAAARAAALRFRFAPARRGDVAIASRILYDYAFELPDDPTSAPPSPPAPAPEALVGLVLLPGTKRRPAAGVRVRARASDGSRHEARTDEHGRFRFATMPAGAVAVEVAAPGIGTATIDTELVDGRPTDLTVRLVADAAAQPLEVTVAGTSVADEVRQSAQAVQVVELEKAKRESADLGEVLARTKGVGVRRAGGLGSYTRFSMNGLTDDQIRFFVDGVPLEYAGFPFGIASIPLAMVDRVDLHSGVVPIRYGADALGGVVDVVTDEDLDGTHAGASYEVGSFDTHRVTAVGSHRHARTGLFVRGAGFFDFSRNDYTVDVEVPDEQGRLAPATVRRFHDRYRAGGGNLEIGVVDRPWARRLLLKVFSTAYDTQLQHNVVMTLPYGAAMFAEQSVGASLRYDNDFRRGWSVQAVAGYAWTRSRFTDDGECVYDWFGRCVRERAVAGEVATPASDQFTWQHGAYGRVAVGKRIGRHHSIHVALSPTYSSRTGEDRLLDPDERDPSAARRDVISFVTGVDYQVDVWKDRVQNVVFFKDYVQRYRSSEPVPGTEELRERENTTHAVGVGDGLRVRILPWMWAKASYEWATRLPRPDEIFGDAMLVLGNSSIEPERSHNANLSLDIDARKTIAGDWRVSLGGFMREASNLIVLLGTDRTFGYQNVFSARSIGTDIGAGWTSPGRYVSIDGNVTYQSFRNRSDEGVFADFDGDRIPNRPYFFANGSAELGFDNVFSGDDRLSLSWYTRYVHEFFRGWESAGITQYKQTVASQITHSLAATYVIRGRRVELASTLEVQNLLDARVYDFFGVQRPGRAFYAKLSLSY